MNDSESSGGRFFLKTALIVLAGWLVFSPAFHGGWLWDDKIEIIRNPLLHGGLGEIWSGSAGPDYFPLKTTVQWVQWRLWQDHPPGYHLTNVALHLLSALLLWRLFRKLGLRLAWLGGLLFVVHPVVVESVAWIAELKNTLSMPLLLLAMDAWLDYDGRKRRADYLRALLLFLAAMLCKSSVVMFPVVLLLHAWWKRGRVTRADLKASAAFFGISLGLGLVTVWFQHFRAIDSEGILVGGFFPRLAGAGLSMVFYFSKCVFPVGLLPIYPRWMVDPPALIQFLPWPLIGAALYGLWRRRETWGRHALFGCGFFLVNLAPVLGFVTMSWLRITWVADHFVYLPLISLIGLATAGAGTAAARLPASLRPPALAGAALIMGLFAFQSRRYAEIFRDEETLWTYTVRRNPEAWLAHSNLGNVLLSQGKVAEAMDHFERALRFRPDSFEVHDNYANALVQAGRVEEAVRHYQETLRKRPAAAEVHYNLGYALAQAGRMEEAVQHYQEALRLKPAFAEAHANLGIALVRMDRVAEAIGHYEEAVRLKPDYGEAYDNLGYALVQAGRVAEAIGHYATAVRLEPDSPEAHYNLGCVLARAGRTAEAIGHYEEAVRLKPDFTEARDNLELTRRQTAPPASGSE